MAAVQVLSSAPSRPRKKIAISSADICSSATSPRAYASNSHRMSSSASRRPSRLARIRVAASVTGASVMGASVMGASVMGGAPGGRPDRSR